MIGRTVDLTGQRLGTCEAVSETGNSDAQGSRIWRFRCTCCDRSYFLSVSEFRRHERLGKTIRCYCPKYREFIKARGVRHPRRCGMCKSTEHVSRDCDLRVGLKYCRLCCSMAHRVVGARCRECGLAFRELPPVKLEIVRGSPAARCLEVA